ncbi:MAG: RNA polymerase sigma factor [Burkholderiaceae bacterium]
MVSENADEDSDDSHPGGGEDEQLVTSYDRRPEHQQCLAEVFRMDSDELLRRLAIEGYDQPGFIPAEVVVSLARSRYGAGAARVRNAVALALNRHVIYELAYFVASYPEWYSVVARDSEQAADAVAEVRLRIFSSDKEVSFSEIAFRMFATRRLLDWCKSQVRQKNDMLSVDNLTASAEEAGQPSMVGELIDESALALEDQLERDEHKKLLVRCWQAVKALPEKQRTAVVLYVVQDMTNKEVGEVMQLDESTVRWHVKSALNALRNGDWHA